MLRKKWGAGPGSGGEGVAMTMVNQALPRRSRGNRNDDVNRLAGFARLRALWRQAFNRLFPLGYEDASGFHYGPEPRTSTSPAQSAGLH